MDYKEFLEQKKLKIESTGFEINREDLNPMLFDFQKDIVKWCLKKGKSAIWADCGLGKTPMQLEFAKKVCEHTKRNVLIVAPLAVSLQTQREGIKFGVNVTVCRKQSDVQPGINITNYEMIEHFDFSQFVGVVLDESSILKGFDRHYSSTLMDLCQNTQYKLSCTATPAPNDFMELGTQCQWLGVMGRNEMLATFFVHDSGDTAKWRLKGHAQDKFWEWVSSWACVLQKPSDLGYLDDGFILPPLNIHEIVVESPINDVGGQMALIPELAQTLQERRGARKNSLDLRVGKSAELANSEEQWLTWCDLNIESDMLKKSISGAVEVKGSDKSEHKEKSAVEFAAGNIRVIVSKPSIFGWGINWQQCNNMIFVGLSDSYEQLYQAIRRCWRFGQTKPVNVYIVISESEGAVKANIERKEKDAAAMMAEMVKYTKDILTKEIHGTFKETIEYDPKIEMIIPEWLEVAV